MKPKAKTSRITYNEAKAYLKSKNFKLLDDSFISSRYKHRLQCIICAEIRVASLALIKNRECACKKCFEEIRRTNAKKWTISDVQKECIKRNIACLSDVYVKDKANLKFKCLDPSCKNEWESTFNRIKNSKYGCRKCSFKYAGKLKQGVKRVRNKYDINLARTIASSNNLKLLSDTFIDINENLDFECIKCHERITKPLKYVKQTKKNCPTCRAKTTSYGLSLAELLILCSDKSTFEFIDNRKALRTPYKIKCRTCKSISIDGVKYIKRNKCRECLSEIANKNKNNTLQQRVKDLELKNSELISKALDGSKAEFLCYKCGEMYQKSLSADSNRIRCPKCYPKLGFTRDKDDINQLLEKTIFHCISDVRRKNGKVELACKVCNQSFESYYLQALKRKACPRCNEPSQDLTKIK